MVTIRGLGRGLDKEALVNEFLRRAVDALASGAADVRDASFRSPTQVRRRLRQTVEEVLDHLEAEEEHVGEEPENIMTKLERQSQDIAEDLRRADRLMKRRMGRD